MTGPACYYIECASGERAAVNASALVDFVSCADDVVVKTTNGTSMVVVRAAIMNMGGVLPCALEIADGGTGISVPRFNIRASRSISAPLAAAEHLRTIVQHATEGMTYACFREIASAAKKCRPQHPVAVASVTARDLASLCRVIGKCPNQLTEWDEDRFARALDKNSLFAAAETARYLGASRFLDSCCRVVAQKIQGMTVSQMSRFFGIVDGGDAENSELATIRRQNGWETWG